MYFPAPPVFDPDAIWENNVLSETLQTAFERYAATVNAVIGSYDVPVGLTAKEAVWTLNKAKLYHYLPVRPPEERHPVPLLLVYALINKPFIFDLAPGRSFIQYMLQQGFDVYLLDWGTPGPEDQDTDLDDYITQYLHRAVRKLLRVSGAEEISVLGYCIGATLTVAYAALYPAVPIRNIILLTAPLDFSKQPEQSMAVWLDEGRMDVDRVVESLGNVPGEMIEFWAKMLKPIENFVGIYVQLWRQIDDKAAVRGWQAINRWVEDVIPFAGEAFRQFVKEYLQQNKLIKGEHVIQGRRVDLANIRASLLNVVAEFDHLVSRAQAETVMELVSSNDKELRIIPSTHVGIMASRRARYKLWPEIATWLDERSA